MWYREGTLSITQGSRTVTGVGTRWAQASNGVLPGMILLAPDFSLWEIQKVNSDTELLLVDVWAGDALTDVRCRIITTYEGDLSQFSARLAATLAEMRKASDIWGDWTQSEGIVEILNIDGTTTRVDSMQKMYLEQEKRFAWFDDNRDLIQVAGDHGAAAIASAAAARVSEVNAVGAEVAAASSASASAVSATAAYNAEINAARAEEAAVDSEKAAKDSEDASRDSQIAAKASEIASAASEEASRHSEEKAALYEAAAGAFAAAAADSQAAAAASEVSAKESADAAAESRGSATASAAAAELSNSRAATSETNAKASEVNAKDAERGASASEANAEEHAAHAVAAAAAAADSQTEARNSEMNAATSAAEINQIELTSAESAAAAQLARESAEKFADDAASFANKASAAEGSAAGSAADARDARDHAALSEANAKASEEAARQAAELALDGGLPITGGTITGDLSVMGELTLESYDGFNQRYLQLIGGVLQGNLKVPELVAYGHSVRVQGDGNVHYWFEDATGAEKAVLWASDDGWLHMRAAGNRTRIESAVETAGSVEVKGGTLYVNNLPYAADRGLVRGGVPGGEITDWRVRPAGLLVDIGNYISQATNIWKCTQNGDIHRCSMDYSGTEIRIHTDWGSDYIFSGENLIVPGTMSANYYHSNGDAYVSGNLNVNDVYIRSDLAVKKDIKRIENALDKLDDITGNTYQLQQPDGSYASSAGLVAQEVQVSLPELITRDSDEDALLRLNYNGMIAVLVEAVKELRGELRAIESRVSNLEAAISAKDGD